MAGMALMFLGTLLDQSNRMEQEKLRR
jgi:hypothetical protein